MADKSDGKKRQAPLKNKEQELISRALNREELLSNVRQRVLKHMNILLTGAAVGFGGCKNYADAAPPPMQCETVRADEDLFDAIDVHARWDGDGIIYVDIALTPRNLLLVSDLKIAGGTWESKDYCGEQYCEFHLIPEEGASQIDLVMTLGCDDDEHVILARLDLEASTDGDTIPVELSAYDESVDTDTSEPDGGEE